MHGLYIAIYAMPYILIVSTVMVSLPLQLLITMKQVLLQPIPQNILYLVRKQYYSNCVLYTTVVQLNYVEF